LRQRGARRGNRQSQGDQECSLLHWTRSARCKKASPSGVVRP
jgi:hypothetical protein